MKKTTITMLIAAAVLLVLNQTGQFDPDPPPSPKAAAIIASLEKGDGWENTNELSHARVMHYSITHRPSGLIVICREDKCGSVNFKTPWAELQNSEIQLSDSDLRHVGKAAWRARARNDEASSQRQLDLIMKATP